MLFAFIFSIAFQARFAQTSSFQRDLYITTLVLAGFSTVILIAPVALHRFLFQFGLKDELVAVTNMLAVLGLVTLSFCMIGAVVLVSDWVGGGLAAILCGSGAALAFASGWFALPILLRRHTLIAHEPPRNSGQTSVV